MQAGILKELVDICILLWLWYAGLALPPGPSPFYVLTVLSLC